jgi:DNA polymerase III epsilon subunit-like protein
MSNNPRGYFKYLLALDVETTGLCFSGTNPAYNAETGEKYQMVSAGLIVVDANTLKPIKTLYVEIQWDGKSIWNDKAEKVHGLSKAYLAENGVTSEDACVQIAELLLEYWGPDGVVSLLGHNVATFDKFFLDQLMKDHGIEIKFGNRHIDSHSCAYTDDAFEYVGVVRNDHNALEDAYASLKVIQTIRHLWQGLVNPNI